MCSLLCLWQRAATQALMPHPTTRVGETEDDNDDAPAAAAAAAGRAARKKADPGRRLRGRCGWSHRRPGAAAMTVVTLGRSRATWHQVLSPQPEHRKEYRHDEDPPPAPQAQAKRDDEATVMPISSAAKEKAKGVRQRRTIRRRAASGSGMP